MSFPRIMDAITRRQLKHVASFVARVRFDHPQRWDPQSPVDLQNARHLVGGICGLLRNIMGQVRELN